MVTTNRTPERRSSNPGYDRHGRPKKLRQYWAWMVLTADTEPVEVFIALNSIWWAIITLGIMQVKTNTRPSPTLLFLEGLLSLKMWVIVLFGIALFKIVGLFFRLDLLRMVGLLGSVGVWMTVSGTVIHFAPTSPIWGGYFILAVSAGWAFWRLTWEKSDILIDFWRLRQERLRQKKSRADVSSGGGSEP